MTTTGRNQIGADEWESNIDYAFGELIKELRELAKEHPERRYQAQAIARALSDLRKSYREEFEI